MLSIVVRKTHVAFSPQQLDITVCPALQSTGVRLACWMAKKKKKKLPLDQLRKDGDCRPRKTGSAVFCLLKFELRRIKNTKCQQTTDKYGYKTCIT